MVLPNTKASSLHGQRKTFNGDGRGSPKKHQKEDMKTGKATRAME
jgi:hypothetical protein